MKRAFVIALAVLWLRHVSIAAEDPLSPQRQENVTRMAADLAATEGKIKELVIDLAHEEETKAGLDTRQAAYAKEGEQQSLDFKALQERNSIYAEEVKKHDAECPTHTEDAGLASKCSEWKARLDILQKGLRDDAKLWKERKDKLFANMKQLDLDRTANERALALYKQTIPELKNTADRIKKDILQQFRDEEDELTRKIDTTVEAVQHMHFDRRAADYDAWIKLSEDSQQEFVSEVEKEITSKVVATVQDKMLETFKHFHEEKAEKLIQWLQQNARDHNSPPPEEIIAAIRRLSTVQDKGRIAYNAKFVLKAIDRIVKGMSVKELQQGLPILLDCVCDLAVGNPLKKQCETFQMISKVTVAALYNNATRRVAIAEADRLTEMTELDLKTLDNYNQKLKEFVVKRNEVRKQIQELGRRS